jgi:hypothetical protein
VHGLLRQLAGSKQVAQIRVQLLFGVVEQPLLGLISQFTSFVAAHLVFPALQIILAVDVLGVALTLTKLSPTSQHSRLRDAFQGRFSPLRHLVVGSSPKIARFARPSVPC